MKGKDGSMSNDGEYCVKGFVLDPNLDQTKVRAPKAMSIKSERTIFIAIEDRTSICMTKMSRGDKTMTRHFSSTCGGKVLRVSEGILQSLFAHRKHA